MSQTNELFKALKPTVAGAVTAALSKTDAPSVTAPVVSDIIKRTTEDAAAVIINQTNQEPWYQSAVTIGAIATLLGSLYGLIYGVVNNGFPEPAEFTTFATTFAGAIVTLWGRWVNAKPLPIGPAS